MTAITSTSAAGTEAGWKKAWPLNKPAVSRAAGGGAVLFVIWTVLGLVYTGLLDDGPVGDADRRVSERLERNRTESWDTWSNVGSMLSDTLTKVALIAVVGGIMIVVWRRWHDGAFLALVVIVESSVFALSSLIVDRGRPPVERLDPIPPSGSFPSGHTAAAVSFYLGLYVVARWHTSNRTVRGTLLLIGVVVPVIVGTSRVYRGMHHVSDVVAGYALGLASLYVVHLAVVAGVRELDRRSQQGRSFPDRTRRLEMAHAEPDPSFDHLPQQNRPDQGVPR